jgi:D-alanine-D-alanine ligase
MGRVFLVVDWHPLLQGGDRGAEARHMENAAVALFGALGCRDYARFDFRAGTDGVIRLLEVNPNSSWCWDGKMAIMAGVAGMSYPGMLQAILDCAWRRTQ